MVTKNLLSIAARQKELALELEEERRSLEENDLVKETENLKLQAEKLRADFEKLKAEAASLADENSSLKNALYEHIFNEKNRIVDYTVKNLDIYFHSQVSSEINKLTEIDQNVKSRIQHLKNLMADNNIDTEKELGEKLDELSLLMDRKITEARAKASQASGLFSNEESGRIEALKNEEISDEQIRAVAKKNNIERLVGLNILNIIGIFLLLLGAIAAVRFTYMRLSDLFKGILIFALGAIMTGLGEILNRKKPTVFSLGISAGGIAILYAALAASYFFLQIMGIYFAVAICILLTVGAFLLSNRCNSQVIAAFALIGGYLPMISIEENNIFVYGAMFYFAALNLFALGISMNRKWRVTAFIGLSLNLIGTAYICTTASSTFFFGNLVEISVLDMTLTIIYALFAFLIYTAIPIISTYRAKMNFKKSDVVLLAINTFFSSLIMYWIFSRFHFNDFFGLLAVIFAVLYLFLGKIIEKKFKNEQGIKALLYLTALAFAVLIIPLQFGRIWLSLGWLVEGILIAVYGILNNKKSFKNAGLIIFLLCLGAFLLFDFPYMRHYMFVWKYTAITVGSLAILGAYMYKKIMAGEFIAACKYFVLVNLWGYAIYILHRLGNNLYASYPGEQAFQIAYLVSAASITATFLIAYFVTRIKLLFSPGIKVLSVFLYCSSILWLFVNNSINMPVASIYLRRETPNIGITIIGTVILAVLGFLSVLAVHDAMKIVITHRKKGIQFLPLSVSGYFIILLSQNLIAQYNLDFSSAAISVIYVLAALAWIIFGFMRRFPFMRRFGLALAIFAVIKLFLIDISSLTEGYRIASYFALGITLIAISFVYQFFSKRLELKEGMKVHP